MLEVQIYRIIQELVGNALKHAKAEKIVIQLNQFDGIVHVLVQDNGIGFNPDDPGRRSGMGLRNIRSRLAEMGGEMDVDSKRGKGTTITLDIPFDQSINDNQQQDPVTANPQIS